MPAWALPLATTLIGAGGSYFSARAANKPRNSWTDQSSEPWGPTIQPILGGFNDAYNLYQRQMSGGNKWDDPPPRYDTGYLYGHLGYRPPTEGGERQQYRRTTRRNQRGRGGGALSGTGARPALPAAGGGTGGFDAGALAREIESGRGGQGPAKMWEALTANLSPGQKKEVQGEIVRLRGGSQALTPEVVSHPAEGGGGRRRGGGGAGAGGGGRGREPSGIAMLREAAEAGNPALDAATDYATRSLNYDVTPHLDRYLGGGDVFEDSELAQRAREMITRRFGEHMSSVGDTFAAAGMGASSLDALRQAKETEVLGDQLTAFELGLRDQNIGLLSDTMNWQADVMGKVPALEQARLAGPAALADAELEQASIQARIQAAQIAAAAQRYASDNSLEGQKYAAELQAQASRYATDAQRYASELSHRVGMANVGTARAGLAQNQRQWEFGQLRGLTDLSYSDEMDQYNWDQSTPGRYIDEYMRRALPVAGLGGRTWGQNVVQGQQTNPYAAAATGGFGGFMAGYGLQGLLSDNQAPGPYQPVGAAVDPNAWAGY